MGYGTNKEHQPGKRQAGWQMEFLSFSTEGDDRLAIEGSTKEVFLSLHFGYKYSIWIMLQFLAFVPNL